jgi:hypothetical protein
MRGHLVLSPSLPDLEGDTVPPKPVHTLAFPPDHVPFPLSCTHTSSTPCLEMGVPLAAWMGTSISGP